MSSATFQTTNRKQITDHWFIEILTEDDQLEYIEHY